MLVSFSLLAFVAAILVLVYVRIAVYLLAASTVGVLVFGYLQLPDFPLPEEVAPVPLHFWTITAAPLLLTATVLAFLGREEAARARSEAST